MPSGAALSMTELLRGLVFLADAKHGHIVIALGLLDRLSVACFPDILKLTMGLLDVRFHLEFSDRATLFVLAVPIAFSQPAFV